MSERDQRRQLAVGAGTSPADPGGHPQASPVTGDVDVVQAVAALVSDLVEATAGVDDPQRDVDDESAPDAVGVEQDLVEGPERTHGDAVAPRPDRGGEAVGPTAR